MRHARSQTFGIYSLIARRHFSGYMEILCCFLLERILNSVPCPMDELINRDAIKGTAVFPSKENERFHADIDTRIYSREIVDKLTVKRKYPLK